MNRFAVVLTLLVAALASANGQACPTIVNRAGWGARAASTSLLPNRPAPYVVVHHTAGAACTTQAACSTQMRNMQNFHMNSNGWADIGYNWCIGGDGRAYEGRGWDRQGVHAPGYNSQSMGMCVIGTFTSALPPAVARNALQQLIACGVAQGRIRAAYWLIGHRQGSATECPGQAFFNEIRTWPRWNANPVPV